jgi:hypothetical protein
MYLAYLIGALMLFFFIKNIIQCVKSKNFFDLTIGLLLLPFIFFFYISILFGGSAFNDAATEYELYQAGHYYLVSHGQWTEVSYGKYIAVLISEIVGIASFIIAFILGLIRILHKKQSKK